MIEKITWLGHAGFRITDGVVIYIDPYQIKGGRKADIILVTHGHYDHCSPEDIEKVRKSETVIVAALSAAGCLSGDVRTLKPGEKISLKDVEIEGVAAYNVGKTFHPRGADNLGFIVTVEGTRIYHAGDTDFIPEMKNVKADIVLLPVGGTYTMTAEEAAEAANVINPQAAVPMHWGSVVGSPADARRFQEFCRTEVRIPEITG